MKSELPKIAVLIPSYNGEKLIEKCLASLAGNTEPHDIVIVDDGSKVPLAEVIAPRDNVMVLRAEKNIGITRALNLGLHYILDKGYEFVARLDVDDTAHPERLKKQLAFMEDNPDVVLLGCWGKVVDEDGTPLYHLNHPTEHDAIIRYSWYNSAFLHPSMMIRTCVWREAGGYYELYPNAAEDYELTRRLAKFGRLANLPEYLIDYSYSINGISVKKRRIQLRSRLRIQWRYRNFLSPHFYFGILKTFVLWHAPQSLTLNIKRQIMREQS